MTKKLTIFAIIALVVMLSATMLVACNFNIGGGSKNNKTTQTISVPEETIYMGVVGSSATYQLNPTLNPESSGAQFLYAVLNSSDNVYVTVDENGLLTAKKTKGDQPVKVRIFLKSDRTVYTDVEVYIELVYADGVSLDSSSVTLELGKDTYQMNATVTPSNASANLIYVSKDENVCRVDGFGKITTVGAGQTEVQVYTRDTEDGEAVTAGINVTVKYAPLSYTLDITGKESSLNQIQGAFTEITASLIANTPYCDPDPEINWYCGGEEILALKDQKNISFTPSGLTVGVKNKFYAKLKDVDGTIVYTYNQKDYEVISYNNLTAIDLAFKTGEKDGFGEGETAGIDISFAENEYPAEQYKWYVKGEGSGGSDRYVSDSTGTFYGYIIDTHGADVTLVCVPVVKGVEMTSAKKEIELGSVTELTSDGVEVNNVYIEGGEYTESNYLPLVYWDAVARPNAEIRVEITKGFNVTIMRNTDPTYSAYFKTYGCFIPAELAGFGDNFSVRVGTDGYKYTDSVDYSMNSITSTDYDYLTDIIPGMNGYISNMEEFGKLLNYISLFRPEDLYFDDGNEYTGNAGYSFYAFFSFRYVDVDANTYPLTAQSTRTDPDEINVSNIVNAAFNCYCDSGEFTYAFVINGEKVGFSFVFPELFTPEAVTDIYALNEVYVDQSYATGDKVRTANVLPIDALTETMVVETSNQLYYALSLGYKPAPKTGSAAESVYAEMRAVLKRICSDSFTEAEKVHAIFDFLSTEVTYDYSTLALNDANAQAHSKAFFLEGVFEEHRAVCDGIAKAFLSLCRMEGINAIKVSGFESVNSVGHAWNKVMVDGKWYGIDATWGSTKVGSDKEYQSHLYLMTTDEILNEKHITNGKTPETVTEPSDIFFGSEVATEIDHIITSAADAQALSQYYFYDRMNSVGSKVSMEVKLVGITVLDYVNALKTKFPNVGYTISQLELGGGTVLVTVTVTAVA